MAKRHCNESADMMETQPNTCTSTQPTQTADSRAEAISPRNATHPNWWNLRSSTFPNHQIDGRICVSTYISSLCKMFYSWCVCPGEPARDSCWSRYADWWRNIHWLVLYLLRGNAAYIHFEDQSSLLSEPASDDEHWSKGTGFWRLLLYI